MKSAYLRITVPAAVLLGLGFAPAAAQDRRMSAEQRLDRLERGLRQIHEQRGMVQPSAAAPGVSPVAVANIDQRLTAIERQLAEIVRQSEENGHRANQLEAEIARLRTAQEERLSRLEMAAAAMPAATANMTVSETVADVPAPAKPQTAIASTSRPVATNAVVTTEADDPAELAYDEGYELWRAGKYDQALTSLRAMASAFPRHRRVSWANNLAGRALLDKGQARAAAEALLANYRRDPKGERAADSLFYLGEALVKLGQPGQACKAYAELEDVYGDKMRGELKKLLPAAKSSAAC